MELIQLHVCVCICFSSIDECLFGHLLCRSYGVLFNQVTIDTSALRSVFLTLYEKVFMSVCVYKSQYVFVI